MKNMSFFFLSLKIEEKIGKLNNKSLKQKTIIK